MFRFDGKMSLKNTFRFAHFLNISEVLKGLRYFCTQIKCNFGHLNNNNKIFMGEAKIVFDFLCNRHIVQ